MVEGWPAHTPYVHLLPTSAIALILILRRGMITGRRLIPIWTSVAGAANQTLKNGGGSPSILKNSGITRLLPLTTYDYYLFCQ